MIEQRTKQQEIVNAEVSTIRKHIHGDCSVHWHDFFEIEYIINGRGKYIIDGNTYDIKPGMIFFMTPINFHELKDTDAEIINIMFSEHIASPNALYSISEHGTDHGIQFDKNDAAFVLALLTEIDSAINEGEMVYVSSLLDALLFKLGKTSKKLSSATLSYVQTAMLYIRNNFRFHITLNDVAKAVELSPAYLSSIFPKETNLGYKEYLNTLRYEYAKKLLLHSDMTIAEICYDCGFEDYANFLRGFKHRLGVSPAHFREINSKKT